jgi:ATP-binding cassette subfamily B protein
MTQSNNNGIKFGIGPVRRIFSFIGPYRKTAWLSIGLLLISVVTELIQPRLIQRIIDEGIVANNLQIITLTAAMMIGLAVFEAAMTIANTFMAVKVAQGFAADVRSASFRKIQSFSFGNLDRFQTGELIVRLSSDVNVVQMVVMMLLRMFVRAPIMIVGIILMMLVINFELAKVMLLLLPLTLVLAGVFVLIGQPLFLSVQKKLDKLNMVLQENLAGIRVVKSFVRMDREIKRFGAANEDLYKQQVKVMTLFSILFPSMLFLINLSVLGVVWFGGLQAIAGTFTVGEILAFTNYLLTSIFPLLFLAIMASQLSAANASAQRIYEVLDSEPKVKDKTNPISISDIKGKVTFENVCFSYGENCGEPVLSKINFEAKPGETIAILGATGSGKTTLVNLIPRFYDTTEGNVVIDSINVKDLSLESLRSNIGVALQEPVLFTGTVRENIKYGRMEASDEEVITAAKISQAHDFIMSFPNGYESEIGQRGVNLSGGQKQRITIARAILIKPKILILDDSTSSVDIETEARIQESLEMMSSEMTVFIIAQRISTVLKADKIIVLENGRLAAIGTHDQLMESSPIYKEIYYSQLGGGSKI